MGRKPVCRYTASLRGTAMVQHSHHHPSGLFFHLTSFWFSKVSPGLWQGLKFLLLQTRGKGVRCSFAAKITGARILTLVEFFNQLITHITHICKCMYTCLCVCTHAHMYHMFMSMHTHSCITMYTHVNVYAHTHTYYKLIWILKKWV